MISEEWHQRLKKLRKAAGMTVPCTCTALLFSFLAAGLGGLSRGALDDERLEGTRNIAQTALFAVLTANAVVAPYMGESVLRTTQRLLGNVVGTLIFIWVALYQQRWLVLITIPIYAFIVCAARYSIFVVDGEYGSYQSLTLSFSVALLVERSHAYIVAAATWRTTGLCLGILSMSLFLTMIPNASTKEIGDKLGDALRGLAKLTNTLAQSNEQLAALAEEEKAAFDQEEAFFESVDPTADADDDAEEGDEEGSGDGEGDGDGEEQDVEDEMPLSRAERVALLKADVVKQAAAVGKLIRQVNSLLVNTGYEIYVGTVFGTRLFLPLPRRGTGIPVGPVVQVTARMAELLHLLSGLQGDLEALSGVGKAGRHRGAGGGNREALLQAYGGADVAAEALAAAEKALEEMASCVRREHRPRAPLPAVALGDCIQFCRWAFKETLKHDFGAHAAASALGSISSASLETLSRSLQLLSPAASLVSPIMSPSGSLSETAAGAAADDSAAAALTATAGQLVSEGGGKQTPHLELVGSPAPPRGQLWQRAESPESAAEAAAWAEADAFLACTLSGDLGKASEALQPVLSTVVSPDEVDDALASSTEQLKLQHSATLRRAGAPRGPTVTMPVVAESGSTAATRPLWRSGAGALSPDNRAAVLAQRYQLVLQVTAGLTRGLMLLHAALDPLLAALPGAVVTSGATPQRYPSDALPL